MTICGLRKRCGSSLVWIGFGGGVFPCFPRSWGPFCFPLWGHVVTGWFVSSKSSSAQATMEVVDLVEVPPRPTSVWWGDYILAYLILTGLGTHLVGLCLLLWRCCWTSSVENKPPQIVTRAMEGQQWVSHPPYLEIRSSREYPTVRRRRV